MCLENHRKNQENFFKPSFYQPFKACKYEDVIKSCMVKTQDSRERFYFSFFCSVLFISFRSIIMFIISLTVCHHCTKLSFHIIFLYLNLSVSITSTNKIRTVFKQILFLFILSFLSLRKKNFFFLFHYTKRYQ